MNERLVIDLVQDGAELPVSSISNEGVIISTLQFCAARKRRSDSAGRRR
jgi:hypothetical protein